MFIVVQSTVKPPSIQVMVWHRISGKSRQEPRLTYQASMILGKLQFKWRENHLNIVFFTLQFTPVTCSCASVRIVIRDTVHVPRCWNKLVISLLWWVNFSKTITKEHTWSTHSDFGQFRNWTHWENNICVNKCYIQWPDYTAQYPSWATFLTQNISQ